MVNGTGCLVVALPANLNFLCCVSACDWLLEIWISLLHSNKFRNHDYAFSSICKDVKARMLSVKDLQVKARTVAQIQFCRGWDLF